MPEKTNITTNDSNENVSWMAEMRAIHAKYFANRLKHDKPALSIDEQRKLHQCWSGIFFWATTILIAIPAIAAAFGVESIGADPIFMWTIVTSITALGASLITGVPIEQRYIDKTIKVGNDDSNENVTHFVETQPQNSLSPQTKYLIAFALLFAAVCIACPPAGAGLGAIFAACHMGVIFHAINVGINVGPTLKAMGGIVLSMKFFLLPVCLMTSKKLMTGNKIIDFKQIKQIFEKMKAGFSGSGTQQTPQDTTAPPESQGTNSPKP